MARTSAQYPKHLRRGKGFAQTSSLLQTRIRKASESRGFAVTRLLTHWEEIIGADIASTVHPVKVGYGRDGFGATLTILTNGANAPIVEMQKERILEKVNACYGYSAISRIRITQTAPTGFAEGQMSFKPAPKNIAPEPDPAARNAAQEVAKPVQDDDLRSALAALGEKILSRNKL